jgi:DNA-binding CsgD family transcriptional regulator
MLVGRDLEQQRVRRLLHESAGGRGQVIVLRGDAGIGKTALLGFAAAEAEAAGMRVLRGAGIEAEAELPFASLHQVLQPVLDRLPGLPRRQAGALAGAFGLGPAAGADRFLVAMGALSLLTDAAAEVPVACLVDDAHWLDAASAEAFSFAARRLSADPVALIFAARDARPGGELAFPALGLPELQLAGLSPGASEDLLAGQWPDLDPRLRGRVLGDAQGNPLAIIEFARSAASATVAGQPVVPLGLTDRVADAFRRQVVCLPEASQTVLLVAAADGTSGLDDILRAAALLGATAADLDAAEQARLVEVSGQSVMFRHPLVRAGVYRAFPYQRRQQAHAALAAALTGSEHADRRAWHLAAAATGPDERVAAELELAARRAGSRSGYAAMTTAYQRAAELTSDLTVRSRRLAAAAQAAADAGQPGQATALADQAERTGGRADPDILAALAQVRARAEFEIGTPRAAHQILVSAALPICASNPQRAVTMLSEAVRDGFFAGDPGLARQAADTLRQVPLPADSPLRPLVLAAAGLADFTSGGALGQAAQARELVAATRRAAAIDDLPAKLAAAATARMVGDDEVALEINTETVAVARSRGMIGVLPDALLSLALDQVATNLFSDAGSTADEGHRLAADTGQRHWGAYNQIVLAWLAALRGDAPSCRQLAEAGIQYAAEHGSHIAARGVHALALLELGTGHPDAALGWFEGTAGLRVLSSYIGTRSAPDLVEAAVKVGEHGKATEALDRYGQWATASGQPWAAAILQRCRALAGPAAKADDHYAEAIRLHQHSGRPFERARTQLLYGEWLRRERRRTDARAQLAAAAATFERLGAAPWAQRARGELRAAGQRSLPRPAETDLASQLTPQELHIVRLAAAGASNRDIAAQLFLSPRTVGYHLYKAYPKLGVSSRTELHRLPLTAG